MMRFRPLLQSLARRARTSHALAHHRVVTPALSSSMRSFSTKPSSTIEADLQQKLLQRLCWEAYLGSGRGSTTLFQSIDVGSTGYISRKELVVFLNSVEGKGVNPKAFQILDVLADDHRGLLLPPNLDVIPKTRVTRPVWMLIPTSENVKYPSMKVNLVGMKSP